MSSSGVSEDSDSVLTYNKINKSKKNNKNMRALYAGEVSRKGNTYSLLVKVKTGTATQDINAEVPQQAEN